MENFKKLFAEANGWKDNQLLGRITTKGSSKDIVGNIDGINYYLPLTDKERTDLAIGKKIYG